MSTVILKKDHGDKKKGETISVPFIIGQKLVAEKIGEYPKSPVPPAAVALSQDAAIERVKAEAVAAMKAQAAEHAAERADSEETHRVALAELADARKQVAALTAERDEAVKKAAKAK